jgi:hypothetical protein
VGSIGGLHGSGPYLWSACLLLPCLLPQVGTGQRGYSMAVVV